MERIISDIYQKDKVNFWSFDAKSRETKEFNRKIQAVNNMYGWLYAKGILEKVAFEFKDYSEATYFALDTKDLEPFREQMKKSKVKYAALAVRHIFDEQYSPCRYSGAIQLSWPMATYRNVDGCVGKSWECDLIQHLDTKGIYEVYDVANSKGVKEAIKCAFEISCFEPSDLVKNEDIELPERVSISASSLALDTDDIVNNEDELSLIISDYLSDTYGYCYKGFAFEVIYNEFKEPSEFVVTDIEWDVDEVEGNSLAEKINAAESEDKRNPEVKYERDNACMLDDRNI